MATPQVGRGEITPRQKGSAGQRQGPGAGPRRHTPSWPRHRLAPRSARTWRDLGLLDGHGKQLIQLLLPLQLLLLQVLQCSGSGGPGAMLPPAGRRGSRQRPRSANRHGMPPAAITASPLLPQQPCETAPPAAAASGWDAATPAPAAHTFVRPAPGPRGSGELGGVPAGKQTRACSGCQGFCKRGPSSAPTLDLFLFFRPNVLSSTTCAGGGAGCWHQARRGRRHATAPAPATPAPCSALHPTLHIPITHPLQHDIHPGTPPSAPCPLPCPQGPSSEASRPAAERAGQAPRRSLRCAQPATPV